ncbi:HAD family hydrolase [Gracilibacillus alcaliphilus]
MKIDSKYSAVFFDLDDTLYDLMSPFTKALQNKLPHVYYALGDDIDEFFLATRHYIDGLWKEYLQGLKTLQEIRIQRYQMAGRDFDLTITKEEGISLQTQYEREQSQITLPSETEALLRKLNNKKTLIGIITNGTVNGQEDKIQTLELTRYFPKDKMFISDEIGLAKPQPEIFNYVYDHCQLQDYACYYIGDSWHLDIEGALQTNWYPIWFNHRNRAPKRKTEGYYEITSFNQLDIL